MESRIGAFAQRIARWTEQGEVRESAIAGLALFRREAPTEPVGSLYEPSVCLVAQGAKRVLLGEDAYIYDANHYLITAVHLPTVVQVISASREAPYLGLRLKLDMREVSQLMVDSHLPPPRPQQTGSGMAVGEVTEALVNPLLRLIDLLDLPQDIPMLAPLIQREILYRLLTGDQGARLRQIASVGSQGHQIARAIDWLHDNFSTQLRVEELARSVNMSPRPFINISVH